MYPGQQPGPYGGQQPYQPYPPQQGYAPQQPYPPQQQPYAPQQSLGEGQMRLDPNLTPGQRELVVKIQQKAKFLAYGFVLGVPLTFGGAHYGITHSPVGFAGAAVGLVLVAVGALALTQMQALKRQLRLITPDAWRSPAAHLPGARKAATQAAYINGLLVLLSFGAAGYLLVKGAGWGAYGNSFGFGALMLGACIPLGMGVAAATTIPQLLRVIPAGAKVGRSLYSIIFVLATTVTGEGIKAGALPPIAIGGSTLLVCAGAMALLGRAARRMRGETH
ncbi:hypothetical protein ACFY1J_03325 [Streptomyces sp. NPDC001406]|uniref:hypothetical protein n=1 Tax=Streptomyces sp. NPDC001406 TaxID=3364572 RepID=UPI00367557EF